MIDELNTRFCTGEEVVQKINEIIQHINDVEATKGRCIPQQQQEWSEEDEKMLSDIIVFVSGYAMKEVNKEWVNFLKSRLPQKISNMNWKPSKEQMKALKEASDKDFDIDGNSPLYRLYEQLKAL